MPVYVYKCCGNFVECWKDMGVPKCRKCGKEMKKQVVNTSFVLKGGGWPGKEVRK